MVGLTSRVTDFKERWPTTDPAIKFAIPSEPYKARQPEIFEKQSVVAKIGGILTFFSLYHVYMEYRLHVRETRRIPTKNFSRPIKTVQYIYIINLHFLVPTFSKTFCAWGGFSNLKFNLGKNKPGKPEHFQPEIHWQPANLGNLGQQKKGPYQEAFALLTAGVARVARQNGPWKVMRVPVEQPASQSSKGF